MPRMAVLGGHRSRGWCVVPVKLLTAVQGIWNVLGLLILRVGCTWSITAGSLGIPEGQCWGCWGTAAMALGGLGSRGAQSEHWVHMEDRAPLPQCHTQWPGCCNRISGKKKTTKGGKAWIPARIWKSWSADLSQKEKVLSFQNRLGNVTNDSPPKLQIWFLQWTQKWGR